MDQLQPAELILFGSRARGDQRPNSDFDLVVKNAHTPANWARVLTSLEEELHTLHKIDLLDFEQLDLAYVKEIQREGIVLYGKAD